MGGFPEAYCRVVATRVQGDDAYVLLDTGSPGHAYLYGVNCSRLDGRWSETSSGNGPGWSLTDADRELGTLSLWGDTPADTDLVNVQFNGEQREEPVHGGAFLAVWWRQPCPGPGREWPRATAFRARGDWMPATFVFPPRAPIS